MSIAAVITTGGTVDDEFARAIGTTRKAFAKVRGVDMLTRTIHALRPSVDRIALVGDAEVHDRCGSLVDKCIEEGASGAENQLRALRAWGDDARLVYATSDMPYITPAAVADVIARTGEDELTMPVTAFADFDRRFPDAPPFGITLAGERVVNGGMFVIPQGAVTKLEAIATAMFDARKNPLGMARIAGLPLLLRFALRKLAVRHIEERATRILGFRARALRDAAPEVAYDVDTLQEYLYAATHA